MTDMTLLTALTGAACALVGTGATFLACKVFYGRRMTDIGARMDKLERSRSQTNGMLLQAKKQIEGLQKDLEDARRSKREARAAAQAAEAAQQASLEAATPRSNPEGLADARARLDLMLDSPESTFHGGGWSDSTTARGFAATQPLSGFGPTVLPTHARAA